jgi:DNA modification methylase
MVMNIDLKNGNCLDVLKTMADNSIDSIVTDPPYGLAFMGKKWDYDVPSQEIWEECLRVLKPGGHLLAFAGTRTQHRMAVRIEDAGFEIRDMIAWVYGCLSEDTEILTEKGWMLYDKAKQERVLAYDVQNDIYQWERPSRWNEYRVESDIAYRIQSDNTDQVVSRGHRCIVERGGELVFVPADELTGLERVPYLQSDFSALPQGSGKLLLETMLWKVEGLDQTTFSERQGQEMPVKRDEGREKPIMEGRHDLLQTKGEVCGSVHQVRSLPCGHDEHGAEGWVRDGTQTDGCIGDWKAANSDGVRSSHQPRCDGQQAGEPDAVCDQLGSQTVRARPSYQTTLATVAAIEYSGLIWCPTVSTGAFVARRNGKVFITGNSGFPKSHDVSKAIDKAAGAERTTGERVWNGGARSGGIIKDSDTEVTTARIIYDDPATEAAQQWQGWGTALKPALEPITVARKPLIGTVVENVLEHGTGGINIDGCRVFTEDRLGGGNNSSTVNREGKHEGWQRPWMENSDLIEQAAQRSKASTEKSEALGRWPANFAHDGSDEVLALFPESKGQQGALTGAEPSSKTSNTFADFACRSPSEPRADSGSAARFFYCAKTSPAERHIGMGEIGPQFEHGSTLRKIEDTETKGNIHPTVKPVNLMRYLCKLVTPPNGTVLDPFMGSGTTGMAAKLEDFNFVGIELSEEYYRIAEKRISSVTKEMFDDDGKFQPPKKAKQDKGKSDTSTDLFDGL